MSRKLKNLTKISIIYTTLNHTCKPTTFNKMNIKRRSSCTIASLESTEMRVEPIKNERIKRFLHLFPTSNPRTDGTIPDHENKNSNNFKSYFAKPTTLTKMNIKRRSSCTIASLESTEIRVEPIKNERIKNNERIKFFVHLFPISNPRTEGTIPDYENKPIKNERIKNKERVRKESIILNKMNIKRRSSCTVASIESTEMRVEQIKNKRIKKNEQIKRFFHVFPTSSPRTEGTIRDYENTPIKNERTKNRERIKKESITLNKTNIRRRSSRTVACMESTEMHVEPIKDERIKHFFHVFPTSNRRTEGTIRDHENKPIKNNERVKKEELKRVQRSSHSLPMCESLHACNFTEEELTQVWQNIIIARRKREDQQALAHLKLCELGSTSFTAENAEFC